VTELALALNQAKNPVIISGAGNDSSDGWSAAVALAEKISAPVLQESFAGAAGFPQHHRLFAGFLSASRSTVRAQLDEFDLILSVGAPVFRQYNYEAGEMFAPGTRVFVITPDSDEAHRSPAELSIIADLAPTLQALTETVNPVAELRTGIEFKRRTVNPPAAGEPLRASQVMAALGELVSDDVILVEETPSSRPDLHDLLPAKQPLGFVSAAMGGLGFGLPAAIGLRMGSERPVIAILGDGSSMYGIQGLWSAAKYQAGALFIILNNGRYAVMDRLDEKFGTGTPAWPAFDDIDFVELSRSLGCLAQRLSSYEEVRETLAQVVPSLGTRTEPLVLVVDVEPELTFAP
jgi:benzoylformate decarboxylase